jgi:O-antigen/teichoic acid export membrane protein
MPDAATPLGNSPTAIARSTLTVLAGSAVALVGAVAIRILIARTLATSEVGIFVLAMGIVFAAAGVASLGLGQAVGQRAAAHLAADDVVGARSSGATGVTLALRSGVVSALLLVAVSPLLERLFGMTHLAATISLLFPVVIAQPLGAAAVGIGRAWGDSVGRTLIREAGGGLLRVAGVAVGAAVVADVRVTAVGLAAGVCLGEAGYALFVWRKGWFGVGRKGGWDGELLRRLPPFSGMMAVYQVESWLDVLVLGLFAPAAVVGVYGLARGFLRAVQLVELATSHGFVPNATVLLAREDRVGLKRLFVRARLLLFSLQWPVIGLSLLAPEELLGLLFGDAFAVAGNALRLLAVAALLSALVSAARKESLIAAGRARAAVAVDAASTATAAVALFSLVPRWGGNGAALAVLLAAVLRAAALSWLVGSRYRLLAPRRELLGAPLLALTLAGCWQLLPGKASWPTAFQLLGAAATVGVGSLACAVVLWREQHRASARATAGEGGAEGGPTYGKPLL